MDSLSPSLEEGVNFLTTLVQQDASLSAVCTARSALSCYLTKFNGIPFGCTDIVKRYIKGLFETKPSFPKQMETWDVNTVLTLLKSWSVHNISLKLLTYKLAMLVALLSGQRCQTIHALSLDYMSISDTRCTFFVNTILKHTHQGAHQKPVEFVAYPDDTQLCIVSTLKDYLSRTRLLRKSCKQLFISFQAPHRGVSVDTISRWLRTVLQHADIDTKVFTAHSTRSASTSAAKQDNIPISIIMAAAGWSRASTFANYYCKQVKTEAKINFGQTLLDRFVKPK